MPAEQLYCVNGEPGLAHQAQVVVGTYAHLGGCEGDLHNSDFFFALQPAEMLTNYYGKLCCRDASQARMFAFLPVEKKIPSHQLDQINALFGPNKLIVTGMRQIERPINVLFQPFSGGAPIGRHDKRSELHRAGIWRNKKRNRLLAEIALLLASSDCAGLCQVVRDQFACNMLASAGSPPCVALLVANIEQAIQVYPHLRGWKLISAPTVQIDGLSPEDLEIVRFARRQPNKPASGIIVTRDGLERLRTCDILVRADGGVGSHFHSLGERKHQRWCFNPAVIFDLRDRHHPVRRKCSQKRLEAYVMAGWRLPGKHVHELDQFLATRPGPRSFYVCL